MNAFSRMIDSLPANKVGQLRLRGGSLLSGALETTTPTRHYHWDGRKRGGDPLRPIWLFQYTLAGHGRFQTEKSAQKIFPGQAFCARIPSAHSYRGDPACPEWRYLWLMIQDPYVTGRLLAHSNLVNRVLILEPAAPLLETAGLLLARLVRGDALDSYQIEELLFRWMLECERWANRERHPVRPKTSMLDFVRRHVLTQISSPVRTLELARAAGLTRSNFSHRFRKTTGQTPAAFVLGLRLEEVARLLRDSRKSVKEISAATGFTSSNQLCKCFRHHFQMSPGSYRALHQSPLVF